MNRKPLSRLGLVASLLGVAPFVAAQEVPAQLVGALASDDFKQREAAQTELLAWARAHPSGASQEIWERYRSSPDPEVRQRCLTVLRELITELYLSEGPGFLGIGMTYGSVVLPGEIAPAHAVLVTTVRQGTPANRAGIQAGDMIVRLDGKRWADESSPEKFSEQIAAKKPGVAVKLGIVRDGKSVELDAVLVRRPANLQLLRFGLPEADEAAEERAAIDAYFKGWLNERILQK
jgi:membrane-associated protease RseP (regulator of RpoE activity)